MAAGIGWVELFFRCVKCILGCRHWLAESPQGVAIEIYLALIAALLLQLYTGHAEHYWRAARAPQPN